MTEERDVRASTLAGDAGGAGASGSDPAGNDPAGVAVANGTSMSADVQGWEKDYEAWRRDRLDLVQASARVWLSVLTTLLGLLGSVVLFKGGSLVTGVTTSGWFQVILITLVSAVFLAAVLAVVAGGMATWGGLKDIVPEGEEGEALPGLAASKESEPRPWQRRREFWRARKHDVLRVILLVAGITKGERDSAVGEYRSLPSPDLRQAPAWRQYMDAITKNADRNRIYLHASRIFGVLAAGMIAALAVVAVIAGTVYPAPAMVIVVRNGQVSCGPVGGYAHQTGVAQVTPVSNC